MGKKYAVLQRIEDDIPDAGVNREFLFCLRKALLLALAEKGRLNAAQFRYAQEKLLKGQHG